MSGPLFQKVDCIMLHVPDVEAALRFYRDELGHELVWRLGDKGAAVRLGESELVLNAERKDAEDDIQVECAVRAAERFVLRTDGQRNVID
jgi:catechol 2,3-dioxygenase-like lactoylglutathione lyase family enzyme